MSDRRMFFKQASAIAAVSWSGISFARQPAIRETTDVPPARATTAAAEPYAIVLEIRSCGW